MTEIELKRRAPKEVEAFYEGMLCAYDLVLKNVSHHMTRKKGSAQEFDCLAERMVSQTRIYG
jgi:hypothetical protein